jgi:hypothetical protein
MKMNVCFLVYIVTVLICISYTALNEQKSVNDALESVWKKVVVAYMNVLSQPGMTDESHRELVRIADPQAMEQDC